MNGEHEFEVWQDGMCVAGVSSIDRDQAMREAMHYAAMYGQDGPVSMYEIKRTEVIVKDVAAWLAEAENA